MARQVADAFIRLVVDEKDLQRAVSSQTGPAAIAGQAAGNTVGSRFSSGFVKGTTVAGAAAGALFTGAIGGAVAFEDQLRTINTVAHLTDAELDGVGKSILDLSRETGKSTDDLTAGFYDLVSAGVPANKAISVLRDSAKFATGALGTTAEAVDVVTSAMNAYGLEAEDSTRITDVFAQAVADGKVTAAELGGSIANIAPIAASAGVSIQEVSAGFALLTAKGVPAAQAATEMRAAISALLTPNAQLNEIQKQTGINFAELAKTKGLAFALEELRKATGGNAEAFAKALGSIEAYQFALATTGDSQGAFREELDKTDAAWRDGGVAQAQYDERMKSAKAQSDKMLASIHALAIEIGGPFVDVLGPAIASVGKLGQGLHGLFLISSGLGGLLGRALGLAWTKAAGTSVVSGLIAKAGSAAATTYLRALILGDTITGALSKAWAAVQGSSKLSGATGSVGKFMGSTLGKFAAVAFAAAMVFEVINTYNDIKNELADQGKAIGENVGTEIASGSVEALEQSKGALEKGIADMANVHDFGIFTNDARANLQKQLDQVTAELQQRAADVHDAGASVGTSYTTGIGEGVVSGTPALVGALDTTLRDAMGLHGQAWVDEAKRQGRLAMGGTAQGILDGKATVDQAWTSFLDVLKNAQTPTARAATLLGRLASKRLAKGLSDSRPEVRAEAEYTMQVTLDELGQIVDAGGHIGRAGMEKLRAAMHSKNAAVREAARQIYLRVKGQTDKIGPAGTKAGSAAATNIAHQLNAGAGKIGTAAGNLARLIASRMIAAINGTAPLVRTGQAPGAFAVGTDFVPRDMLAYIHRGEIIVPAKESEAVRRGEAAVAFGGAGAVSGGDTYQYNLTVDGLIQARDTLEVAREMRRVARFGPSNERTRPSTTVRAGTTAA